jgi:hypothetical protein
MVSYFKQPYLFSLPSIFKKTYLLQIWNPCSILKKYSFGFVLLVSLAIRLFYSYLVSETSYDLGLGGCLRLPVDAFFIDIDNYNKTAIIGHLINFSVPLQNVEYT